MTTVSIIGSGNMGSAIGAIVAAGGNTVEFVGRDTSDAITGDIVVLAVPHPSLAEIVSKRGAELAGKIVVDITNPLNFETFDSLVAPADGSKAGELQLALPESRVLKAFNTNFAATLAAKTIGSEADHGAHRRRRRGRQGRPRRRRSAPAAWPRSTPGRSPVPASSRRSASCSSRSPCRRRSAGRAASRSSRSRQAVPLRYRNCARTDASAALRTEASVSAYTTSVTASTDASAPSRSSAARICARRSARWIT